MENLGQIPKSLMDLNSHPGERGHGCSGNALQYLPLYAMMEFLSS